MGPVYMSAVFLEWWLKLQYWGSLSDP
jgi:hypothetical protein